MRKRRKKVGNKSCDWNSAYIHCIQGVERKENMTNTCRQFYFMSMGAYHIHKICIKEVTNENILYSTGKSIRILWWPKWEEISLYVSVGLIHFIVQKMQLYAPFEKSQTTTTKPSILKPWFRVHPDNLILAQLLRFPWP